MVHAHDVDWEAPVFVVSSGRSGSTFLADILNATPDLGITHEAQLLHFLRATQLLAGLEARRDLEDGPFRLHGLIPRRYQEIVTRLNHRHSEELLREFYLEVFRERAFKRWGDKFQWAAILPELLTTFPRAQVIHLVRDGRDVAASARAWSERLDEGSGMTLLEACDWWLKTNGDLLDALKGHAGTMRVRYEELVADPDSVAEAVFMFLELPFTPLVGEYIRGKGRGLFTIQATSENPAVSVGRWKRDLTEQESAMLNERMADLLAVFGYAAD